MNPILVAVKIWAKAVFLFVFSIGIRVLFEEHGIFELVIAVVAFVLSFIFLSPLLLLTFLLVKLSVILPSYSVAARTGWLVFFLSCLLLPFYGMVHALIGSTHFKIENFETWIFVVIGILLLSVLTTRKSLNALYEKQQS